MIVQFQLWQAMLYLFLLLGTGAMIAWLAYDAGVRNGAAKEKARIDAKIKAIRSGENTVVPRTFVQRQPAEESGRHARSGRARIIPRKQATPEVRREKPKKQQ